MPKQEGKKFKISITTATIQIEKSHLFSGAQASWMKMLAIVCHLILLCACALFALLPISVVKLYYHAICILRRINFFTWVLCNAATISVTTEHTYNTFVESHMNHTRERELDWTFGKSNGKYSHNTESLCRINWFVCVVARIKFEAVFVQNNTWDYSTDFCDIKRHIQFDWTNIGNPKNRTKQKTLDGLNNGLTCSNRFA